jgi:hypothetical protein
MADIKEIRQYEYYVFSSRDDTDQEQGEEAVIIHPGGPGPKAVIILYGGIEGGATTLLGYVHFYGGTEPLDAAEQFPDGKYLLYYRYADLDILVDMLRNEKPVYLIWEPEGVNNSRISTLAEVVGEGELEKS